MANVALMILLPPCLECGHCIPAPPHLVYVALRMEARTLHILEKHSTSQSTFSTSHKKVFFKQTMNTHDHGDAASWLNILGSAGSYTSRNLALDPNLLAGIRSPLSKMSCYGYQFI